MFPRERQSQFLPLLATLKGKQEWNQSWASAPSAVHTSACLTPTRCVVSCSRRSLKENTISTWPSNCVPHPSPPRFSCCFLSQGPLWWATTLPKKLPSVICSLERVCIGTGLPDSLCGVHCRSCPPHQGTKQLGGVQPWGSGFRILLHTCWK